MSISARMKLSELLEQHPDAEEILENYGVDVGSVDGSMTLEELCREEAINYWEIKREIITAEGWDGAQPTDGRDDEDESATAEEDEDGWGESAETFDAPEDEESAEWTEEEEIEEDDIDIDEEEGEDFGGEEPE